MHGAALLMGRAAQPPAMEPFIFLPRGPIGPEERGPPEVTLLQDGPGTAAGQSQRNLEPSFSFSQPPLLFYCSTEELLVP